MLNNPPGRRPSDKLKLRSEWFRKLNDEDQEFVRETIYEAVNAGIFHLLCVIDGVAVIDDEKGAF